MDDDRPLPPEAVPGPDDAEDAEGDAVLPVVAEATTGQSGSPAAGAARPRRELILARDPLFREKRGYRMRLEPADLARLRELPGSKGKSDEELGEAFFDAQADRFTEALSEDVPAPADIRVVVDPYSRQAFLALERTIRAILSF
jgi:hypothetical protein